MGGGLLQLVAQGAQDINLTQQPQMTYFKASYKRHTNFAKDIVPLVINGKPKAGASSKILIPRNGDLIHRIYIEAESAAAGANDKSAAYLAERLIRDATLTIGGQLIDKHYQRWWRLFSELNHDDAKKDQWSKMCNDGAATLSGNKVYLPLIFFFNRNPGLALPLMALQYSNVEIGINWSSELTAALFAPDSAGTFESVKAWGEFIYLDTEERRAMTAAPLSYLIEQVQYGGMAKTITRNSSTMLDLEFNHPVKEIVWCCPKANDTLGENLWNLSTGTVDAATQGAGLPHQAGGVVRVDGAWSEDADGPLASASIQVNGQDISMAREGKYYNCVQPYMHHSGTPTPGIYVYSFALKPEAYQPSGTCNFTRIDHATLRLTADADYAEIYAVNYNVLKVASGMGAIGFGN